jgi:hypothetical protein
MASQMDRFRRAFEANRRAEFEVTNLDEPLGRRTCFDCGARRLGCMLITLGDEEFVACQPCTERILKLDQPSATGPGSDATA